MPDRVISVPQAAQIATRIKNKFDNVNGRLTDLSKTIPLTFSEENIAIATNTATVSFNDVITRAGFRYAIVDCAENDIFVINGSGDTKAGLWAFCSDNGARISSHVSETTEGYYTKQNNLILITPPGATKLVINDNSNSVSYKVLNTRVKNEIELYIDENYTESFDINDISDHAFLYDFTKITGFENVFDYDTKGYVSSAKITDIGLQSSVSTSARPVFFLKDGKNWHYTVDLSAIPIQARVNIILEFVNVYNFVYLTILKMSDGGVSCKICLRRSGFTTDVTTEQVVYKSTVYPIDIYKRNNTIMFYVNKFKTITLKHDRILPLRSDKYGFVLGQGASNYIPKNVTEWKNTAISCTRYQSFVENDELSNILGYRLSPVIQQAQIPIESVQSPDNMGGKCIKFSCDYHYPPSDSNDKGKRYHSMMKDTVKEQVYPVRDYGIFTSRRFTGDYYFPSMENIISDYRDIFFQAHESSAYILSPMIEFYVKNGKFYIGIHTNDADPSTPDGNEQYEEDSHTHDYTYMIGDMIYDKWFTLEVSFRLSYTKMCNPFIIVKINGKVVFESYTPNDYNLNLPSFISWGLYATSWRTLPDDLPEENYPPGRTCYMRNVIIEA